MINPVGFVLPAAAIGVGSLLLRPKRGFFTAGGGAEILIPQAVMSEDPVDELEITQHPVEQGAVIGDHAFKRPAEITIKAIVSDSGSYPVGFVSTAVATSLGLAAAIGGTLVGVAASLPQTIGGARALQSVISGNSPSQAKAAYELLLALQVRRVLFDVYTKKRVYKDMLLRSLAAPTNAETENSLLFTAVLQQVIIVTTQTVTVPINVGAQANPEITSPTVDLGQGQLVETPNVVSQFPAGLVIEDVH